MGFTSVLDRRTFRSANFTDALPIAVPALAAFVATVWNVGRPSMYGTEAVTRWAAQLPLPSLFHVLSHVDAVHGAYYLLMHFVLLAGGGTFVLRLPSVIAMTVAAGATARLTRRLSGSNSAALFAGLVLAGAPLTSVYGQAGRSYAIDTAAAVITWSLFLTAVQDARPHAWRNYTLALAVTAYLHEMTLFVIAANVVTLVWARSSREVWRRFTRAVVWGLVLAIPLLVASYVQSRQVSWIKPATLHTVRFAYQDLLGPGVTAVWINSTLIAVCLLAALLLKRDEHGVTVARFALPILVVSPMLLLLESMTSKPLYGGVRYIIWALPAMAMLAGTGLAFAVRITMPRRARVAAGIVVLVLSFSSQWTYLKLVHTAKGAPQDLLAAATYLKDHERTGDGVIFSPRSYYALRLGYPHDLRPLRDLVLGQSGRYGGRLYGTEKSPTGITEAVDASSRIWLVGDLSPVGQHRPELVALDEHFRLVSTHRVTGIVIRLYERVN